MRRARVLFLQVYLFLILREADPRDQPIDARPTFFRLESLLEIIVFFFRRAILLDLLDAKRSRSRMTTLRRMRLDFDAYLQLWPS